jgi:hypothetical protein
LAVWATWATQQCQLSYGMTRQKGSSDMDPKNNRFYNPSIARELLDSKGILDSGVGAPQESSFFWASLCGLGLDRMCFGAV